MIDGRQLRNAVLVLAAGFVFHIFFGFYYHIDKYLTGWSFFAVFLLGVVTFFTLCYFLISGFIQIIRNRNNLTISSFLPAITALVVIFFPWGFDSESLEGKVEMRACYEGTQNQSTIKFRTDSSFEVHSTGIFFASFWSNGQWRKAGDTIFMKFDGERPRLLSDTIILREESLFPIREIKYFDSLKNYRRHYYLGYCRGEN